MIRKQPWFERKFPTGLPAEVFPVVVERLRGTPARLDDRVTALPAALLTRRSGNTWSVQENAGHLLDMEPLWLQRVEDFLAQREEMTVADLTNRKTHEANHNAAPIDAFFVAEHDDYHLARISELVRDLGGKEIAGS